MQKWFVSKASTKSSFRHGTHIFNRLLATSDNPYAKLEAENKIKSKIASLEDHIKVTGLIAKKTFLTLVKNIQMVEWCDSATASILIKACGQNCVELLPHERQRILNNLFEEILPKLNIAYNTSHYDYYLANTLANRSAFDPYKISRQIFEQSILTNLSINNSFLTQLCNLNDINIALLHLRMLIGLQGDVSVFDLNTYKNEGSVKHNELYDSVLHDLSQLTNKHSTFLHANLLNPFIKYYFAANDTEKGIRLFKQISKTNFLPNNVTYFSLINGYLHLKKHAEAEQLFDSTKDQLLTADLLSLYTKANELEGSCIYFIINNYVP